MRLSPGDCVPHWSRSRTIRRLQHPTRTMDTHMHPADKGGTECGWKRNRTGNDAPAVTSGRTDQESLEEGVPMIRIGGARRNG